MTPCLSSEKNKKHVTHTSEGQRSHLKALGLWHITKWTPETLRGLSWWQFCPWTVFSRGLTLLITVIFLSGLSQSFLWQGECLCLFSCTSGKDHFRPDRVYLPTRLIFRSPWHTVIPPTAARAQLQPTPLDNHTSLTNKSFRFSKGTKAEFMVVFL